MEPNIEKALEIVQEMEELLVSLEESVSRIDSKKTKKTDEFTNARLKSEEAEKCCDIMEKSMKAFLKSLDIAC